MAGDCPIAVVNQGAEDVDLAVLNRGGMVIASDVRVNPDPEVTFRTGASEDVSVVVVNASDTEAVVVLCVLEK